MIVLAGDIGGTNSRLGLYEAAPGAPVRALFERSYPSAPHSSLEDIAAAFLGAASTALEGRVGRRYQGWHVRSCRRYGTTVTGRP